VLSVSNKFMERANTEDLWLLGVTHLEKRGHQDRRAVLLKMDSVAF
jgi:hypothetical protein